MKKKIIALQGIPASWKSTFAKKFIASHPLWVRVNKDDIRRGLGITYEKFDKNLEAQVIDAERNMVLSFMRAWMNVIVDNTHLVHKRTKQNKHINYYQELAKKFDYDFEIKTFYIDEDEARARDEARGDDKVGSEVFDKMKAYSEFPWKFPANPTFLEIDEKKKPCIICDLDGTLAFMNGKRSPYDYSKVVWDGYNARLGDLLKLFQNTTDVEIIFLSGRKAECQKETKNWLRANGWSKNKLIMRNDSDTRCDTIVKREMYEEHIEPIYNVVAVFDDRNRVVDMWRELNLPVYQVWYGDF